MTRTSLVVLSGGLDSTVVLYSLAKKRKTGIRAVYFDIGYLSSVAERNAAKAFCYDLSLPLEIVDIRGIFAMVSGFVPIELLGLGELDKGQPGPIPMDDNSLDKDYVSGFHMILSAASYYAMLGKIGTIHVGIIREQIRYTKGLKAFLKDFAPVVRKLNPHRPFSVDAPFASKGKAEVIKLGMSLSVDLSRTWSCYRGGPLHCGTCNGCKSRKISFQSLAKQGIVDPTSYAA